MADFNKKPEFQDKKTETKDISKEEMNKMIRSTVDYTEQRCERRFRVWLAETVELVSGISMWMVFMYMAFERAKVLPTEPHRDMNGIELIFAVVLILSVVFAECVRNRNM